MNEYTLHDPQLQSLEARLSAMPLQVSASEQQQLLYQCAFAAGKKNSARSLRYWQVAAAFLVILTLGMSVPLARDEWLLATQRPKPPVPTKHAPVPADTGPSPVPALAQDSIPHRASQVAAVDLDAWQLAPRDGNSFADEMARLETSDPHLRSLTVGTLTRAVLNP